MNLWTKFIFFSYIFIGDFMKILGVLGKNNNSSIVYDKKYLKCFKNINVIGIFPWSDYSICDAYFIQGGKNVEKWFFDVIEYAIKNNKPILGICLGCQVLGLYGDSNASLKQVNNHNQTNHMVYFEKNSFLYDLYGVSSLVNSKHYEAIDRLSDLFQVIAYSKDGVIEAIQYKDSTKFIVGLQWHPEEMQYMYKIFDIFLSKI